MLISYTDKISGKDGFNGTLTIPQYVGDNLTRVEVIIDYLTSIDYLLSNKYTRPIRYGEMSSLLGYDLDISGFDGLYSSVSEVKNIGSGIVSSGSHASFNFSDSSSQTLSSSSDDYAFDFDLNQFIGTGTVSFDVVFEPWVSVSLTGFYSGLEAYTSFTDISLTVNYY